MGRFPSQTLLMRPEAQDMGQIFIPICKAMKAGDFRALRSLTGGNERYPAPDQDIATSREWAMKFSLSYKLWFLCDVITWRSLARRTFLIAGFAGEGKKAPTMNLEDLVVTAGTQDPYLVWPNGEPPWYNNIDRLQWITDQRAEWDKEIAQWTPNPEDDVKQYWWEPDKDGPRMMKGFAFGQPSSGDYQNPLNKAALSRFRRYKQSRELLKRDLIKEQIEVFGDEDTKDGNTEESGFAGATFNNEFLRPPQAAVQAASSDSGGSTFDEDMEVDDVPLFIPEQYADHTPPGYDSDTDSLASNTYTGPFLPLPLPPAHPIPTRTYPPPRPLTPPPPLDPSMPILSVVASLISSKLIHAFVSWKQRKLGILGAKAAGGSAVKAGFPTPWATLVKKMEERDRQMDFKEGYVPGWVRIEFEKGANIGRSGGVVRLSNVRGVGE
ncbi:MAG: hypothetical protein M1824_006402 [Vezdaea acicularis]|nr:MAG: hypothetical protein M1824_006402 [Vezdaea acicularis]